MNFIKRLPYVIIMPIMMGILGAILYIPFSIINWFLNLIGYELCWFHSITSSILWFSVFGLLAGLNILFFPNSEFARDALEPDAVFENEPDDVFQNESDNDI